MTSSVLASALLLATAGGDAPDRFTETGAHPDWLRMRAPTEAEVVGPPPRTHYARMGAEFGATLFAGFVWYWNDLELNQADWDLRWDQASWRKKAVTFEAVRFDTNGFNVNVVYHPWAHALLYSIARSNDVSPLPALGLTALSSTAWEYLIEFRELVSLNDLVMSPVGGFAIGEPFMRLSQFFARSRPTPAHAFLAGITNPVGLAHQKVGGQRPARAPLDRHGLPTDVWHRFDVAAGVSDAAGNRPDRPREVDAALETQIVVAPGFSRPGTASRTLGPGDSTHLRVAAAMDRVRARRFQLWAETLLVGLHTQSIRRDPRGGWHGARLLAGLASAFEHELRDHANAPFDQIGFAHILGGASSLAVYLGGVALGIDGDVFTGFSLVRSQAYPLFLLSHPVFDPETARGALIDHGYYYAWHLSPRARASVSWNGAEVGAEWRRDFFESIDGLDRRQDTIATDVHLSDRRTVQQLFAGYRIPATRMRLLVTIEGWRRQGQVEGNLSSAQDTRGIVHLGGVL